MTKHLFFILSAAMPYLSALSQPIGKSFTIEGEIKGQTDGSIVLSYPSADGKLLRDTSWIKEGKFHFTGNITTPVLAGLTGKVTSRGTSDPNFTSLFIGSGNIKISLVANDFKNIVVEGSNSEKEYASLNKSRRLIEAKYRSQLDSLRTEKDHEKNAAVRERLGPYFDEVNQSEIIFFSDHPNSYVTAYMLRMHFDDLTLDSLQMFYNKMSVEVQRSNYGRDVAAEIHKLKAGSPGSIAKDFATTDINGKDIKLSDYRGKYVLIDFWASWCVPCRKGSLHLKELYAKYSRKGMEIIGVADDDRSDDAWKAAVAKDGTGIWRHVRRGMKTINDNYDHTNDINEKFGIHSLPTRILIDPGGKIIGRYGEKENELDNTLANIFR